MASYYRGKSLLTIILCVLILLLLPPIIWSELAPSDSSSSDSSSSSSSEHLRGEGVLRRVYLTGNRLENGMMVEYADDTVIDFSNATDANLFGLSDSDFIVPGNKYTATMELENTGDITFDYWMEVRLVSGADLALAEQLKVTVQVGEHTASAPVNVGVPVGDDRNPIGKVLVDQTVTFTVSVEFIEHEDNNWAQDQRIVFDLYVYTIESV